MRTAREPILGWRIWKVRALDGALESVFPISTTSAWAEGKAIVARCGTDWIAPRTRHEAPQCRCSCGIWAHSSRLDSERSFWEKVGCDRELSAALGVTDFDNTWAVGQVSLWGRVIEHERGYRAQYAYPYSILVADDRRESPKIAAMVRDRYRVEATL